MNQTNNGGAAFPSRGGMMVYVPETARDQIENAITALDQQYTGMTLRDYFAAQALATVPAYPFEDVCTWAPADIARHVYMLADAMLAERAK
jgi:hypothetical protein